MFHKLSFEGAPEIKPDNLKFNSLQKSSRENWQLDEF